MSIEQQIAYCTTSDGVQIAYGTYGNDDAPALVHLPDVPGQEAIWKSEWGRAFFASLARHRRLITLDVRGRGSSERDVDCSRPESLFADIAAVVDHLGLGPFDLFADRPAHCALAIMYTSQFPANVVNLTLFSPMAASSTAVIATAEAARASFAIFARSHASILFPSGPPEVQRWFSTAAREWSSGETVAETVSWTYDLSTVLRDLTAPVLILHRSASQICGVGQVRKVTSLIPGARLVSLDGNVGAPYWQHEQYIDRLYDFLGVEGQARNPLASGSAVILFTDIVDSTGLTERMGDAAYRALSRDVDERVRAAMRAQGGTVVEGKVLGDGVMGVFTSASQAIDAARACVDIGQELPMHVGLHAGDVTHEAGNVYGGTVNIASRICGLSAPGEILVSDVVRGMARSSAGVVFEDRGERAMKGVGEAVRVYAVVN